MKKTFLLGLGLFLSCLIFAQEGKTYHVTANTLNLRSEPTTSSDVVEKLNQYDNVIILKDTLNASWYYVQIGEKEGYVAQQYLKKGKSVVSTYEIRVGAQCKDGTSSTATGRGACSHHGGVAYWKTKTRKSVSIVDE